MGLRTEGWNKHQHQFRVEAHRFLVGPRLSESKVSAFEQERGIRIPNDYRAFLLHVGEGGAGPYYGLLPLKRWADLAEKQEGSLAVPSPLVPGTSYGDDWDQVLGIADDPYRGILPISEQGSGGYCALVVSGEARGRVVYLGDGPPYFVWDRSFIDWYERWLDEPPSAGMSWSEWIGRPVEGGEPDSYTSPAQRRAYERTRGRRSSS